MINSQGKRVTRATIKSFIAREFKANNLYIQNKTNFDGMVDCVMPSQNQAWSKAVMTNDAMYKHNLGVSGAWFVGQSKDYFMPYSDDNYIGYEVHNSCGSFLLAIKRIY